MRPRRSRPAPAAGYLRGEIENNDDAAHHQPPASADDDTAHHRLLAGANPEQGRFGTQGNFELVTAMQDGGLAHFWRNNDDPSHPWSDPTPFGGELGQVGGVTMIQSNFGSPGNLEVICSSGAAQLNYFWRDSGPSFTWHGPFPLASTP